MSLTVLVSIDGMRPDALQPDICPNLTQLLTESSYTLQATTVMPSITLPCHTSLFHSVPPTRHGILSNVYTPMARPLPGLIDQAHAAGKRCATFFGWEELRDLSRPGSITLSFCLNTAETDPDSDRMIAETAARYLNQPDVDFAFVYFGTVDTAGHKYGWMSSGYLEKLQQVDQHFQTLRKTLPADTHLLVQSDHGGHDRSHGTELAEDMTIPWIAHGPNIRRNYRINSPISILDTAPTLARSLNISTHPQWEGNCIDQIFAQSG
jgi:predicted AlkP superfamily pyrophosphatase or phosphodiesterase